MAKFVAISRQAIIAKMVKMAIMAIVALLNMATNMAIIGVWKEQEKYRSPAKMELKKIHPIKSYGHIKIYSKIMAVSFVFSPHFSPQSSALCFWNL